jgi:hypothetical protein
MIPDPQLCSSVPRNSKKLISAHPVEIFPLVVIVLFVVLVPVVPVPHVLHVLHRIVQELLLLLTLLNNKIQLKRLVAFLFYIIQCCGSRMLILDPIFSIPDSGSGSRAKKIQDSGSKNLSIFNPKKCF